MERDDQPLTPAGRMFVQPLMDQVINCSVTVDSAVDVDTFKSEVEVSLLLKNPRFCSIMVRDSGGREYWRRTKVDMDRHLIVRRQPLSDDPSVSDEDAVNDYIADLTFSSPLPTDKPLWEIHLLAAHNTIVYRVHHALGDGISLMSMMLSCCRRADDPALLPDIGGVGASSASPPPRRRGFSAWKVLMMVWYTLVYVFEFMMKLIWVRDKITAVSGGAGVELWPRKLTTARFRLEDMKTVKRAVANATINDVLFGVISLGLSSYLDTRSSKSLPEGLRITGLAMVNLRPQQGLQDISKLSNGNWGNKFGMLLLPVYYHRDGSDPLQFVKRAKEMIDKKKLSLEAPFSYGVGKLIMSLFGPKFASICNYRIVCNTSFTISNVMGPREKITMAGNHVKHIRVTSSSLPHAITMHMVSYANMADLQILVAKDLIPDPKLLAKCFEDALIQLKVAAEASTKS